MRELTRQKIKAYVEQHHSRMRICPHKLARVAAIALALLAAGYIIGQAVSS